jgi:hypothetical protein
MNRHLQLSARTRNRFVPRFDTLEDRAVPAVTATYDFGTQTLAVEGDAKNNNVGIVDNGNNFLGSVTVYNKGLPFYVAPGPVTNITIDTLGGNDQVFYQLGGASFFFTRNLEVNLGAGNDNFVGILLQGALLFGSSLTMTVNGEGGKDALTVSSYTLISPSSAMTVSLNGGGGNDNISVTHNGPIFGTLTANANGNDGRDSVIGQFFTEFSLGGTLNATFEGGAKQDFVLLLAPQPFIGTLTINAIAED